MHTPNDQTDDDYWIRQAHQTAQEWAGQRDGPATSIAALTLLVDLIAEALREAYERGYTESRTRDGGGGT
jgi:hypothetical protein